MNKEVIEDYDPENDIMSFSWGKSKHSIELFDGSLVLDFGFNGEIVGFEIFNYLEAIKQAKKDLKDKSG